MKLKYIELFEDFSDHEKPNRDTLKSWTEIRDAIQMKKPFVILVFKNNASLDRALDTQLSELDTTYQDAVIIEDGDLIKYPSLFFTLDRDSDYSREIREIYSKFSIKQAIVGGSNKEHSTFYSEDGTSSTHGNEIVTSLEAEDFSTDDHFIFGSHYYKFIEFYG